MKKYLVKQEIVFVETDHRTESNTMFECNSFASAKNWTGDCLRLEEVNTLKINKGKEIRKERKRGEYITVDTMSHWKLNKVTIYDNETKEIVYKNY